MRKRMSKTVSACMMAGCILAGAQTMPALAAETEAEAVTETEAVAEAETAAETVPAETVPETENAETETETVQETEEATEAAQTETETETETEAVQETEKDTSMEGELIFAQCAEFINVRSEASTDSEVTAKMYNNDSAVVISQVGDWYEIQSGNAYGYVSTEYFATGDEAAAIAEQVAYNVAVVHPDELNVRSNPSEDGEVIDVAYSSEELEVVAYDNDWMKVALGDDVYGYVNAYYVEYKTYYPTAETLEEEAARLEAEEAVLEETEETEEYTEEVYEETEAVYTETEPVYTETEPVYTETEAPAETEPVYTETEAPAETEPVYTETEAPAEDYTDDYVEDVSDDVYYEDVSDADVYYDDAETEPVYSEEEEYVEEIETDYSAPETEYVETEYVETEYVETEAASSSGLGQEIVNYAAQFVGNPYVYGGTSLTEGADCSGFVQSVFANYGIYLSRVAADQAGNGTSVDLANIQPGDLLFYSSSGGGIDHVAIYAGNGAIVHAANSNTGIVWGDAYYSTPVCAVRCW